MCNSLFKSIKVLMTSSSFRFTTSSSFWCVATAIKVEGFRGFLLNISKTDHLIFTKRISFLRKISIVSSEIKRLTMGYSLLPW